MMDGGWERLKHKEKLEKRRERYKKNKRRKK